jgi:hypothetical protein
MAPSLQGDPGTSLPLRENVCPLPEHSSAQVTVPTGRCRRSS